MEVYSSESHIHIVCLYSPLLLPDRCTFTFTPDALRTASNTDTSAPRTTLYHSSTIVPKRLLSSVEVKYEDAKYWKYYGKVHMCSINAICPDSPSQSSIHSTHFVIDTSSIEGGQKIHGNSGWLQDFGSKWSLLKQKIILVNVWDNLQCLNIANLWTSFILIDRRTLTSYLSVPYHIRRAMKLLFLQSRSLHLQVTSF